MKLLFRISTKYPIEGHAFAVVPGVRPPSAISTTLEPGDAVVQIYLTENKQIALGYTSTIEINTRSRPALPDEYADLYNAIKHQQSSPVFQALEQQQKQSGDNESWKYSQQNNKLTKIAILANYLDIIGEKVGASKIDQFLFKIATESEYDAAIAELEQMYGPKITDQVITWVRDIIAASEFVDTDEEEEEMYYGAIVDITKELVKSGFYEAQEEAKQEAAEILRKFDLLPPHPMFSQPQFEVQSKVIMKDGTKVDGMIQRIIQQDRASVQWPNGERTIELLENLVLIPT